MKNTNMQKPSLIALRKKEKSFFKVGLMSDEIIAIILYVRIRQKNRPQDDCSDVHKRKIKPKKVCYIPHN
jgi:hypothetical protein